ncbi:MAG: SIMPL domain-containing protein [Anaerolineae bacterium]|nr:SIMPL domain-containing protein [Anaerolineae bacterium]
MKTKPGAIAIASTALLAILLLSAWTDNQPSPQEPRRITVTGEAEVRVVPDEVILALGVETWDKNLNVAKSRNDEIVKRVIALAGQYGIEPEHVQTDYLGVEPRYRDGYYEERDFVGYFVHKTIVITLRDLSRFEDLLTASLQAGVNYVHGINFRTTELRQHRDQARALAIKAAKEKAVALAGELGQQVGDPLTIQEEQGGWWSSYGAWWGSRWGGAMTQNVIQEVGGASTLADSSVAPGQIEVTARVTVSFELTK